MEFRGGTQHEADRECGRQRDIERPTGDQVEFDPDGAGGFDGPDDANAQLSTDSNGWTLTQDDGEILHFNTQGALDGVTDAQGRVFLPQTTSAAGATILGSYGTSSGQRANFSYNGDVTARELDDPSSHHHYYTYTASKLSGYSDDDGQSSYGYDANGLLDSITLSDGTHAAISNLADGRVAQLVVTPPGGSPQTWSFDYSTPGQTTVTGPDGTQVYSYGDDFRVDQSPDDLSLNDDPNGTPDPDEVAEDPDDPSTTVLSPDAYDQLPAGSEEPDSDTSDADGDPDIDFGGSSSSQSAARGSFAQPLAVAAARYRVAIDKRYIGDWATIRNNHGAFIVGNAHANRATPKASWTFDKIKASGKTYFFGRFYGTYKACGWINAGNLDPAHTSNRTSCGSDYIAPKMFSKLVDCDRCNHAIAVPLRTDAKLYRNIRPFSSAPTGSSPMSTLSQTRTDGSTATIGFRYLTPDYQWIAISSSALSPEPNDKEAKADTWGFVRASAVVDTTQSHADIAKALCTAMKAGNPQHATYSRHQDWPQVCKE